MPTNKDEAMEAISRRRHRPRHRKQNRFRRNLARWTNNPAVLVAVTGLSYLTTFARERYFFQRSYGLHVLDHVEVGLSALTVLSNVVGLLLVFLWVNGRISPRRISIAIGGATLICAALATASPLAGETAGIAVASTISILVIQRAADAGRQLYGLLGAVSAPLPTIWVWSAFGVQKATIVFAGYLVGSLWQALITSMAAIGAEKPNPVGSPSSPIWPLIYVLAIQIDGLADQGVLVTAGAGWAGADALSYNIFAAAVLVVVGPISSQALSGRFDIFSRRFKAIAAAITTLYLVAIPPFLGALIKGGAVNNSGYTRLRDFCLLYGCGIAFSIYWQTQTRVAHRNGENWQSLAKWATILLAVHLVALVPIILAHCWTAIPLATVLSFFLVSILWALREPRTGRLKL